MVRPELPVQQEPEERLAAAVAELAAEADLAEPVGTAGQEPADLEEPASHHRSTASRLRP